MQLCSNKHIEIAFEDGWACPLCALTKHNNTVHDFIESKGKPLVFELVAYQHKNNSEKGEAVQTSHNLTQICPECNNDHSILQHHGKAWQCSLCGAKWGQTAAIV